MNCVITCTEAKCAALCEMGVMSQHGKHLATGTTSDAIVIAADQYATRRPIALAGLATEFGRGLAQSVYYATICAGKRYLSRLGLATVADLNHTEYVYLTQGLSTKNRAIRRRRMLLYMNPKQLAGEKAVEWIKEGMRVGLGTGSTVYYTIMKLGEMVKQGFVVEAIPTSKHTEELAKQLNIPLTTFADIERLDVTIDGADAVTPELDLIKGGGGALLREKLVAEVTDTYVIVVDESKRVSDFNREPIPIEVVPFAWEATRRTIVKMGGDPSIRKVGSERFITDNHNYILDTAFDIVADPWELQYALKRVCGIVETGLFPRMADYVVVAGDNGIDVLERGARA